MGFVLWYVLNDPYCKDRFEIMVICIYLCMLLSFLVLDYCRTNTYVPATGHMRVSALFAGCTDRDAHDACPMVVCMLLMLT